MAKNYVQPGETLPLTAPYDIVSGAGFLVGSLFAVALSTASSGGAVEGRTCGVFDLAKASGGVTAGQKVYWDNAAKNCTTTSTSNTLIGVATQSAASGDATVRVKLGIVA
jgi:predicted RecA/RadA family phage recombinase